MTKGYKTHLKNGQNTKQQRTVMSKEFFAYKQQGLLQKSEVCMAISYWGFLEPLQIIITQYDGIYWVRWPNRKSSFHNSLVSIAFHATQDSKPSKSLKN